MKPIINAYLKIPLIVRLILGLAAGLALGYAASEQFYWLSDVGALFLKTVKHFAPLLVFVVILSAIASTGEDKRKVYGLRRTLVMFVASTAAASFLSILVFSLHRVGIGHLAEAPASLRGFPNSGRDLLDVFVDELVCNPLEAIHDAKYLSLLFWGVLFGLFLRKSEAGTKQFLADAADAVKGVARVIIELAPFGVMGLSFHLVESGMAAKLQGDYQELALYFILLNLAGYLILTPLIVFIFTRQNALSLMPIAKESMVCSFFTCSSAANIPVNEYTARVSNVSRPLNTVAIPLGAAIHKPGSAICLNVTILAVAYGMNMDVSTYQLVMLGVASALGSACCSGTLNGHVMMIPVVAGLFGFSDELTAQVVGLSLALGFARDSFCVMYNSSSDLLFVLAVDKFNKKKGSKFISAIVQTDKAKREQKQKEYEASVNLGLKDEDVADLVSSAVKTEEKDVVKRPIEDAVKDAVKGSVKRPVADAVKDAVAAKDAAKDAVKDAAKDAAKDAVKDAAKDAGAATGKA